LNFITEIYCSSCEEGEIPSSEFACRTRSIMRQRNTVLSPAEPAAKEHCAEEPTEQKFTQPDERPNKYVSISKHAQSLEIKKYGHRARIQIWPWWQEPAVIYATYRPTRLELGR
jgi:hypothetical protein